MNKDFEEENMIQKFLFYFCKASGSGSERLHASLNPKKAIQRKAKKSKNYKYSHCFLGDSGLGSPTTLGVRSIAVLCFTMYFSTGVRAECTLKGTV